MAHVGYVLVLVSSEFWELFLHACSKCRPLYFYESETAMFNFDLRVKLGRVTSSAKIAVSAFKCAHRDFSNTSHSLRTVAMGTLYISFPFKIMISPLARTCFLTDNISFISEKG